MDKKKILAFEPWFFIFFGLFHLHRIWGLIDRNSYNFTMKIGGTTYEISTHFNPKGRQCVMEQFKELILSEHLI